MDILSPVVAGVIVVTFSAVLIWSSRTRLEDLKEHLDTRFDAVDRRFDAVDRRFEAVDRRFEAQNAQFDSLRTAIADQGRELQTEMVAGLGQLRTESRGDLTEVRREVASIHETLAQIALWVTPRQQPEAG